ncbi:uncharacterized protein G2W53_003043 [Senna tora]|uniref:Transmembrane protein n=1 Tax=Senna tora TaxID=362788 RepID=A0A834X9K8_9FABA|nr:uncharacterized protein G2W53_003043 [Senna tora]
MERKKEDEAYSSMNVCVMCVTVELVIFTTGSVGKGCALGEGGEWRVATFYAGGLDPLLYFLVFMAGWHIWPFGDTANFSQPSSSLATFFY